MNSDDYDFYLEDQKYDFIQQTFFDHMYETRKRRLNETNRRAVD